MFAISTLSPDAQAFFYCAAAVMFLVACVTAFLQRAHLVGLVRGLLLSTFVAAWDSLAA